MPDYPIPETPFAPAVDRAAICSPILYLPVMTPRGVEYAAIPTGMSQEYFDFLINALDFHAKNHPTFITKEKPEEEPPIPADWVTCEYCGGTGADGFDRCYPPNPYVCDKCDGKGKVPPETAASWPTGDIMECEEPSSPENDPALRPGATTQKDKNAD